MRSKLARLRGLIRRYRVDRRLPPPVTALIRTTVRLRVAALRDRSLARLRPPIGDRTHHGASRWGSRRLFHQGPLDRPVSEVAVAQAHLVQATLDAAGVDSFVVRRDGDRIEIGLDLEQRQQALTALSKGLPGRGWCVRWPAGDSGTVGSLSSSSVRRRVAGARSCQVFQAYGWGERVIAGEAAVTLSYWQIGSSGQLELVGTRGHERFHSTSAPTIETIDGRPFTGRAAFPIADTLEHLAEPVDVVVTWVDGGDPDWAESFRRTATALGRSLDEHALDPARYRSRDELRYALRSIWAYCGWVRRIHLVTAGQRPDWLVEHHLVNVVDHREILPAAAIPTFNSHAIEASLHHIDGLAEHFVYFNDDMFVGRPLRPEAFFTPNGLARVFQSGARVHAVEDNGTLAVDTAARRGRELLRERFGRVVTSKPLHAPYPLRRSSLHEIDDVFPQEMADTRSSRFRAPTDLSVAASFGQHYALATGTAVLGEIASEYVHVESGRLAMHLERIRLDRRLDTFCINETQDGHGHPERERMIAATLRSCFPVAAPWERDG